MEARTSKLDLLETQPVGHIFFRYLIPSSAGMFIMAINFIADGIMVGNRLGPIALAGVGLAAPAFTLFLAVSLWLGIGGATKYSQMMGEGNYERAQLIFTQSIVFIVLVTLMITLIVLLYWDQFIYLLGANQETYPFVSNYLKVLFPFWSIFTIKNALNVFVRNDGDPNVSMAATITEALSNIGLNYIFLYIVNMGISGAALGTVIASFLNLFVISIHFFKRINNLRFVRIKFERTILMQTMVIGFPSLLAIVGTIVFTISHNVTLERISGTDGVIAFSILNYVHSIVLLMFMGLGSAVQPLISYYHGAKKSVRKQQAMQIAIKTTIIMGILFFATAQLTASNIVSIFGNFPETINNLSITGLRLFFIAYLFMGINFVLTTYYQSIANVRLAVWITVTREIVLMLVLLFILPLFLGVNGVWLVVPLSELLVLSTVYIIIMKSR